MSKEEYQENISTEEIKIVISTCDSKVNGSLAGIIAVIFGEFGILRLYVDVPTLGQIFTHNYFVSNIRWYGLTISYVFLGFIGLFFAYRAIAYSELSARAGDRLGRKDENGKIHLTTKVIFDDLVDTILSSGWDRKLKKWAVRQESWLKFFFFVLYIAPFVVVAIKL